MKTKILLSIMLVFGALITTNAQTFKNGDFNINAGLGLGYTYGIYSGSTSWPAIVVSGEKGFKEIGDVGVISLGGIVAFKHISYSASSWSWNDFYVGGRGALHLTSIKMDKLDVYGGASLGLRFYTYPEGVVTLTYPYYDIQKKTHATVFFGIFGGAKYSLTEKIGIFGELGYDVSWIKLGVSFKL